MKIFKEKTPNQKLFNAVAKANVKKVREALEAGANVNEISTSNTTPLDAVARTLEYYDGRSGLYSDSLNRMSNLKLVWNELVRNGGKLNLYKDDPDYNEGCVFSPSYRGVPLAEIKFNAPKR